MLLVTISFFLCKKNLCVLLELWDNQIFICHPFSRSVYLLQLVIEQGLKESDRGP